MQDLSRPMRNNQSTNQCAAQSCSFTCTFFVLWRTFDNNGGKRAGKFIGVIKKQRPRNNSSLERVDSRVQHIWRLRVMGSWQKLSSHYGKTAAMIFPPRFQLNLVVTLSPGLRKWGRECIVERQQQENRTGMRPSDQELARDLFGASIFWPPRSRLQWLRCYGGTTEISLWENRNRIFKTSTTIQSIFQLWLCLWKGNDRFWCVLKVAEHSF